MIDRNNPIYVGITENMQMFSRVKTKENKTSIENGMAIGILGHKIENEDIRRSQIGEQQIWITTNQ